MLVLRVQAAFGAFRHFTAGSYRNSAPFITPSAAYGLLLNIAGIESRFDDGVSLMTRTRPCDDLPTASIALGMIAEPKVCNLYQQLHSYPPGEGNKVDDPATGRKVSERKLGLARTKQGKWRITPVRRELLCGIDGYIALTDNEAFENQVRDGLTGGVGRSREDGKPRYGVPFLGDNNYLIDRLALVTHDRLKPARWFCFLHKLPAPEIPKVIPGTCRMTVSIDRADMSKTRSFLFVPLENASAKIPEAAWVRYPSE